MTTAIDYIYPKNSIDDALDTMRDNIKPDVHIQIEDCKRTLQSAIRLVANTKSGSIERNVGLQIKRELKELKRLCALPKQAKASDGKLSILAIKRLLEADKLHAMHIACNRDVLEKLHSFGSITRTQYGGYCVNVEYFAPKKKRLTLRSITERLLHSDYTQTLLETIYPQEKSFKKGDTVQVDNIPMKYKITETVVLKDGSIWYKLQNSTGRQLSACRASSLRKVS